MSESPKRYELPKILVVDDERAIRKIVSIRCRHAGYNNDFSEDGVEAWQHAQSNAYHLIITDYQMPIMNGIELCQHLRRHELHIDTPIIMLSAIADELDRSTLEQQLSVILLQKPHDISGLSELIAQTARPPRAQS